MVDGQWNDSFIVNVANNRKEVPESVVWVQLEDTSGGALLASRDETTTKILIASNIRDNHGEWIIIVVSVCVASVFVLLVVSWCVNAYRKKGKRAITKERNRETEMPLRKQAAEAADGCRDSLMRNLGSPEDTDFEMETTFTTFKPGGGLSAANPLYETSCGIAGVEAPEAFANPLYESADNVAGQGATQATDNPLYAAVIKEETGEETRTEEEAA